MVSSGCGGNPLGRMNVSGEVTLDSKPLPQGLIQFEPTERGEGKVGSGTSIKDGKYSIPSLKGLPPGEYRIRIHSSVVISQSQEGDIVGTGYDVVAREIIPPAYNVDSKLIASVSDSEPNTFNFKLQSH